MTAASHVPFAPVRRKDRAVEDEAWIAAPLQRAALKDVQRPPPRFRALIWDVQAR
jgi:hypothetical protein